MGKVNFLQPSSIPRGEAPSTDIGRGQMKMIGAH
jgi:hypothetical protein